MLNDTARVHMMIGKLCDLSALGRIEGDWVENFIWDMHARMKRNQPFTDGQIAKIEELFEQC